MDYSRYRQTVCVPYYHVQYTVYTIQHYTGCLEINLNKCLKQLPCNSIYVLHGYTHRFYNNMLLKSMLKLLKLNIIIKIINSIFKIYIGYPFGTYVLCHTCNVLLFVTI